MFCLRSTFYLFIRVHNVLKGWVLFPIDAGENVVCRVERGGSRILLGQVDPLLMLVSSDLAVTARSETKIDYTKKRRSFYVTLLSVCLLDFVRKKVRNSRTIDELLKDFMPIYIISIYQITNWNENFGFFVDYPLNPYNGVVCNDTITATGVFSSKELWNLSKGFHLWFISLTNLIRRYFFFFLSR